MSRRGILLRLAAELAIIFAGVFGAFWVEGYLQEKEDRDRATTILAALAREIGQIAEEGPYVRDAMGAALAAYDSAMDRELTVPPPFYQEPAAETAPVSVWKATLASGGVNLLDPELFFDLAAFYNRVESFSGRYLRYNLVTEQEVLPLLSRGPEAFYDPQTGSLEPRFQVHVDQLRTLHFEAEEILSRVDSLKTRVEEEAERHR